MNDQAQEPLQELDCSICNDILFKPVTISCGHTFCKECLLQFLKQKPVCPLCRSPTFLQTNTLNENITLRNIIEAKYPDIIRRREQESNPRQNSEFFRGDIPRSPVLEHEKFENFFTLKVPDVNKYYLFPGLTEILKVSCELSTELFNYVCQDKRFIVLPENSSVLPLHTYLGQCHEIMSATDGKMQMEVRILKRVLVEKTALIQNENEDLLKKFAPHKNFSFFVTGGRYIEDNQAFLESLNGSADLSVVENLIEFFKKNLTNLSNVSPNTFVRILHKIGEANMKKLFGAEPMRDFPAFSTFSFVIAGSLRAKPEEKRRMFETINVLERLEIARNIIKRFNDIADPLQIFDVDIPTQKMFSLKYSIFLILAILIVLYYNRFYQSIIY